MSARATGDDGARTEGGDASAPPDDVVARLAALERENATLRREVAEGRAALAASTRVGGADGIDLPGTALPPEPARRHRGRAAAAVVLVLLGALLAPLAVVAAWGQRELTDTDRYVATVAPLASDPVIQSAVAGRLTETVMAQIDVGALLDQAVGALEDQGLPPRATSALSALEAPLANGVEGFVRQAADRVVESDAFGSAWEQANRVAHEQLVAVMTGTGDGMVQIGKDGQLTVQLSGMIDLLKQRLVDRGLGIAANIPEVDATFTIMQTSQLVEVQNRYAQLVALGTWLPWVSLGLLAAGVLASRHRLRTLTVAGLSLAAAMVLLGVCLAVARGLYLDALSGTVERLDAAEHVFDQLVAFIRVSLRTVGVLGLVVALAAYLGGSSASARSLRGGISRGFARARDWGEGRGVTAGPVGTWIGAHRTFVRVAIVGAAAVVLLLASSPTPALVVVTALVAGVLVALAELVARPAVVQADGEPAAASPLATGTPPPR